MPHNRTMALPVTLSVVLLASLAMGTVAGETEDNRVSVIYTGDPYPGKTPYLWMKVEPLLTVTAVQASRDHYAGIDLEDIRRAIRIYMPRTYESLAETYDVVIISDANVDSFSREQLAWFKSAIEGDAIGLVMVGGHETYGTNGHHPDWGQTPVGDVLPVETAYGGYESGRMEIIDEEQEFMASLPWREGLPFLRNFPSNMVTQREGSRMMAKTTVTWDLVYQKKYLNWVNPFFTTWDYAGAGRVFAMTGDWTPGGGAIFMEWDYYPDFVTNLMLYVSKRSLPQDLNLVHTIRTRLSELEYRRMLVSSLIDFVERFGANPRRVLLAVAEFDGIREEARELYLRQEFSEALEAADEALGAMERAEEEAERTKNQALLWIYVSEWLTVTATSLLCGFILWSLMVRRSLYREVETTAFRDR